MVLKERLRFSVTTSHDDRHPRVIHTGSQLVPVLPHLLCDCRNSADESPTWRGLLFGTMCEKQLWSQDICDAHKQLTRLIFNWSSAAEIRDLSCSHNCWQTKNIFPWQMCRLCALKQKRFFKCLQSETEIYVIQSLFLLICCSLLIKWSFIWLHADGKMIANTDFKGRKAIKSAFM